MFCQEIFQLSDTWDKTVIFPLIHCYTVFAPAPIELKEKENHSKTKMSNKHSTVWKKWTMYHLKSSPAVCSTQIHKYLFYSFNNNFMILSYLLFYSRAPETLPIICWRSFLAQECPKQTTHQQNTKIHPPNFVPWMPLYSIQNQISVWNCCAIAVSQKATEYTRKNEAVLSSLTCKNVTWD